MFIVLGTARKPFHADAFALLNRLPREDWQSALTRLHTGVRQTDAHPAEVVAWTLRDTESTLADFDRLLRSDHPLMRPQVEALRAFRRALVEFPGEAELLATYALHVERAMEIFRPMREGADL